MSSLQAKDYARYQAQAQAQAHAHAHAHAHTNGVSHDVVGDPGHSALNGTATAGPSAYAPPSPARDAVNYAWPSSTARYPSQQHQQQQHSQPGSPQMIDAQAYGASAGPSNNYGGPPSGLGLGAPADSVRQSQISSYRPSMDTLANQAYASTSSAPRQMRVSSQLYSSPNQSTYSSNMSRHPSLVGGQQPASRRTSHAPHPSQSTTIGPSASSRFPSSVDLCPSNTRPPLRSRVFGLGADMRPQTELADPAFFPGGIVPPEAATLAGADGSNKEQPIFSVELKAYSFDQRGYPVYGGRAASIQGSVRMRQVDESDVVVKISAHTTSGSAAAVWDGVALQPPESGAERTVFTTSDRLSVADGRIEHLEPSPSPTTPTAPRDATSSTDDTAIVHIPFVVNMPVGGSTRVVDGNTSLHSVALPPSFEMSSEQDSKEKAVLRNTNGGGTLVSGAASIKTSKTRATAITIRDAIESGLQQVYRVGCFYRITFTLVKASKSTGQDRSRKSSGGLFGSKKSKSKKAKGSNTISIPFVFLGEPTPMPPTPSSLPPISPIILKQPSMSLAPGWESEMATAKWSGMLFKTMKRNVELEMFLPGKVIQAPSIVPFLLVLRPDDPDMLPQPSVAGALIAGASHPGSPRTIMYRGGGGGGGDADTIAESTTTTTEQRTRAFAGRGLGLSSPSSSPLSSPGLGGSDGSPSQLQGAQLETAHEQDEMEETLGDETGAEPSSSVGGTLSRFIRSSLSISRGPSGQDNGNGGKCSPQGYGGAGGSAGSGASATAASTPSKGPVKKKSSRSTFSFVRRPNTAPSRTSSEGSPVGTEASYTIRGGGEGSSSGAASGGPMDLSSLVRVSLMQNIYYSSSNVNEPPKNKRRLICVADLEEIDLDRLADGREPGLLAECENAVGVLAESKARGVRVLRGLLRVGREATPSFRVQGIELKYAVKVDLLPFSPGKVKPSSKGSNPSSTPPRTPPYGRPSMVSTLAPGRNSGGGGGSFGGGNANANGMSPALLPTSRSHPDMQQQQQLQQGGAGARQSHQSMSMSMSASNSGSGWSPPTPGMNPSPSLPGSMSMSMSASARSGIGASPSHNWSGGGGGGGSTIGGGMSEAGWTRRSPSDQTVMGPESNKLHKSVGSLWINVRLVKGRGSL